MEERAVTDVFYIHPHPIGEGNATAAANLPDAGQSGCYVQTASLPLGALVGLLDRQRPRANQRHVAEHDIPELR